MQDMHSSHNHPPQHHHHPTTTPLHHSSTVLFTQTRSPQSQQYSKNKRSGFCSLRFRARVFVSLHSMLLLILVVAAYGGVTQGAARVIDVDGTHSISSSGSYSSSEEFGPDIPVLEDAIGSSGGSSVKLSTSSSSRVAGGEDRNPVEGGEASGNSLEAAVEEEGEGGGRGVQSTGSIFAWGLAGGIHASSRNILEAAVEAEVEGDVRKLPPPTLVGTPEEFIAAAKNGEPHILVMNHMDFTQLAAGSEPLIVLGSGTEVVRGDCHREAPHDYPFPADTTAETNPDSLPLVTSPTSSMPRITGQCILVVSGSFMHVDSPSSHRMWLNDLYIHVAAPSQEQLDQVQASPSAAPELRHRSLCTEMSLPVGNRSLSDVSTGHCENVPKLLEIASGKVWASYVTMQGNGGSVMGLSVGLGATLYMESSVLTNLGGATDVAHMHDTAAFTACTFMNNSLAPDSAILFAQDMGAVRLQFQLSKDNNLIQECTFPSNEGGYSLLADMESNTFFSDDTEEEASYGVLNWNNTQQGRRLSVQTLEKLAVLTDEGGVEGLFLSADDSWFVARKMESARALPPDQASGASDRFTALMVALSVVGMCAMLVGVMVGATVLRRCTADADNEQIPKFWATNVVSDDSQHDVEEEEDQGISVSGKSAHQLMPPLTVHSNFGVPLPEESREEPSETHHSITFDYKEPEQEMSYLTDELPDYQAEESSFCLPNPLQLKEKFGVLVEEYHMHRDAEVAGALPDTVTTQGDTEELMDMDDDSSGYRNDYNSNSIEIHGEDETGMSLPGPRHTFPSGWNVSRGGRNIPMRSFQQNSSEYMHAGGEASNSNSINQGYLGGAGGMHAQQCLGSGYRGCGSGGGRNGMFSGRPPLTVVPEESSRISTWDGASGDNASVVMHDSITSSDQPGTKAWW